MARITGARKIYRYTDDFKLKAVKLTEIVMKAARLAFFWNSSVPWPAEGTKLSSVLLKHSYGDAGLLCSGRAFDNGRDLGTRRCRI